MDVRLLQAATDYAELGYAVFPCAPGTKRPLTEHGVLDATLDLPQIDRWWTEHPTANIGLATRGLIVIDVDGPGNPWLADEPQELLDLAQAPMALTPRGGRHYVFRQPEGKQWRGTAGELAPHVDTRADGNYIVVPPSVLSAGNYRWADGMALDVAPENLPEPPGWLAERLDGKGAIFPQLATGESAGNSIPSGQRNSTLASLAGTMRRAGMTGAEILAAIRQANADRCAPPLADDEVERIAASIGRYKPDEVTVAVAENHWQQTLGRAKDANKVRFTGITSQELAEGDYELTYLIDGLLVRGQPGVIAGPKKTLKTNISIDLAISLSHAGLFLGRFNVPEAVRVGVMSGESGAATIQETAKRIAEAKDWRLEDLANVIWSFEIPSLASAQHIAALREFVLDHELEVLILDPTYLMMVGLGNDAGNLFVVGEFLKSLGELAHETGSTPLLCHHLKKSVAEPHEPAELENIAWAGFQEFVRQWILLNRRVRYDPDRGGHHELWMSCGGSAGHSGLWGLNIDEGTRQDADGRHWEVEVLGTQEAYADRSQAQQAANQQRRQRQEQSQQDRDEKTVLAAFDLFPFGETKNTLRDAAGFSGRRFGTILGKLLAEGLVEPCEILKSNGRRYAAYRRSRTQSDAVGQSGCPTVCVCGASPTDVSVSECPDETA